MVTCAYCRRKRIKCKGDGAPICPNAQSHGEETIYLQRQKAGPKQGWVDALKQQVTELKQQLLTTQQEKTALQMQVHVVQVQAQAPQNLNPGFTFIGEREMQLLKKLLTNSLLVPCVPAQTTAQFVKHISTDCSGQLAVAQQACLNAVLALSALRELVEQPHEGAGSVTQRAAEACAPYFEAAKEQLKECFSLPCLDTICALLALSSCCQILNNVTSAFMYANIASSMCPMASDVPRSTINTCEFLTKIRSIYTGALPAASKEQDGHERFLQITAHIMQCFRAWHGNRDKWWKVSGQPQRADDEVFKVR